jgi:hypothetical protein
MLADTTRPAAENSAANSSALVLKDRLPTKTFVCRDIRGQGRVCYIKKGGQREKTKGSERDGCVRIKIKLRALL